jgi:GNAT superfamily N-acetyltransferase
VAETVTIRPAGPEEAETLLRIQRAAAVAAFSHVFPQDRYPFPSDSIRNAWLDALNDPEVDVYLAEADREPVGSVSIGQEFLRTLYVVPSHWGGGIGSALHDLAVDRLRAKGVRVAKLWTLEGNEQGRRFYEHRGWMLINETRVVPFPPNPIDVCYSLDLTSTD